MDSKGIPTKHIYTKEEAALLVNISKWVKAVSELKESEKIELADLGVSNVQKALSIGAKTFPNKLIFPRGLEITYLSMLIYQISLYLRVSQSLPPHHAIGGNLNNIQDSYLSVELAKNLKSKLDEDYKIFETKLNRRWAYEWHHFRNRG